MKNFHYIKTEEGYVVKFNSTVFCACSTVKEAKRIIAETKRKHKYSNLIHKLDLYSNDHKRLM